MLTIKNQLWCVAAARGVLCALLCTLVALLSAGCLPPGPRALLDGKKLLEQGKYAQAVEKLRTATSLLITNGQAWNYLGLACQQAGQFSDAEKAYQRALALDHDLTEAHYNLGCLWLAQNKLDGAKAELTAFTLRRANWAEGFVQLGNAQLRSRELAAAEKSFSDALRLSPQNPEALTGLGLARVQRGRAGEAVQFFRSALKQQPAHRAALLNLAIVEQEYLKERQAALEHYRAYLALKPPPENSEAVRALVRQLEQELSPPARPAAAAVAAPITASGSPPKSPPSDVARAASAAKPTVVEPARTPSVSRLEPATNLAKPAPPAPAPPQPASVEAVKLETEPAVKPARDIAPAPTPPEPSPARHLINTSAPMALAAPPKVEKHRYLYRSPSSPVSGNRSEAERAFAQGVQAQQANRLPEAVQAYRRATQLDPAFFDAHYNLGVAASEMGNLTAALAAYENALAIRPESLDGRYNFALVLKQANYPIDAANEFEKLLVTYPNESRTHLALGNLYAQQLHQPAKARQHYLKVLETDPRNPQAGAIRYWLTANPK